MQKIIGVVEFAVEMMLVICVNEVVAKHSDRLGRNWMEVKE